MRLIDRCRFGLCDTQLATWRTAGRTKETVFDLSDGEIAATFQLLSRVKAWMDREFLPDGYNIGLELRAGRWAGAVPCPFARYSKVPTGAARGEGNQVSPQVGCKPMVDGSS